jgi:transposase, IS30 family
VIAARLGKAVSTVSREVAANGGRGPYRAWRAHQRAREQARRPKRPKLACPQLAAQVTGWLEQWWSPQQIARRLRIEYPGDPMMRVSHETIYQALFVQGRGELRRELARCLAAVAGGRPAQSSRGRGRVRRSAATSCRSTSSSASLDAAGRPSSTSQPQTRMTIR